MLVNPIPIIITAVGIFLLIKLRFFFILHPVRTGRRLVGGMRVGSAFRSLCLALAGTLGVGNILGVCVGLSVGGAGSVFWMLASTPFAAVLKYSEVTLCADNLSRPWGDDDASHGGMFYVMRGTWRHLGKPLSVIYALGVLLLGLVMGAGLQSNAVRGVTDGFLDTPPAVLGGIFALILLFSVVKGAKIIEKITAFVIPVTTVVYILLTCAVIMICSDRLPEVVSEIMTEAFTPGAIGGGVLGFLTTGAVKEGFSRGLLSNEAGAGTSSMALARDSRLHPSDLGLMGIAEVVFDTVLLCSLTAFAVLCAIPEELSSLSGMELILSAVGSVLGTPFADAIRLCVFLFAYSTVICWYYYGCEAHRFLFGECMPYLYFPIYIFFAFLGFVTDSGLLIYFTDLFMLVLTLLTCVTLIKNSGRIRRLSELGGIIKLKRECEKSDITDA